MNSIFCAFLTALLVKLAESIRIVDTANLQSPSDTPEVLAFIPGVSEKGMSNVKKHVQWLQKQNVSFECVIYDYDNKVDEKNMEFQPCHVIQHKGQWMDHFSEVPLNTTKSKYVLHLLESVEIQNVDLRRMINTMIQNDLVHVAPALYGDKRFPHNMPHAGFGRFVQFIEHHIDLWTRDNFACLQSMVDTQNGKYPANHRGWGVDEMMHKICPGKIGVIDAMKVVKRFGGKNLGSRSYDSHKASHDRKEWFASHGWNPTKKEGHIGPDSLGPLNGILLESDPQCKGINLSKGQSVLTEPEIIKKIPRGSKEERSWTFGECVMNTD